MDLTAPLTLEGASLLHQMFRVRWEEWRRVDSSTRQSLIDELADWLANREGAEGGDQSAAYAVLGHKCDLMLVSYRRDFVGLLAAQMEIRQLRIAGYLELATSYLSIVELGLYESTRKICEDLSARGLEPGSEAWEQAVREVLERQRKAMAVRLWPEIPASRYICFYPMDRKRGEQKNWYVEPFAERQRMMHDHGLIGRKYAGTIRQVISGSIGLDDWEWGVDLYADSPVPFKQIIYEMRFDEASAIYAQFGPFYVGLRVTSDGIGGFFRGEAESALQ